VEIMKVGGILKLKAAQVDCLPKPTPRYILKNTYGVYLLKDL